MGHRRARPDKAPARADINMRTMVRCLCGKSASPSRSQAKKLYKKIERSNHNTDVVRFYECPEGNWHWTRMSADEYRAMQN